MYIIVFSTYTDTVVSKIVSAKSISELSSVVVVAAGWAALLDACWPLPVLRLERRLVPGGRSLKRLSSVPCDYTLSSMISPYFYFYIQIY